MEMLTADIADVIEASMDSLNSIFQHAPCELQNRYIAPLLESLEPRDHVVALVVDSLKRRLGE